MNKSDKQSIAQMSAGFADTVQAIINRSCIIDYGIVKDIPASGVVTVEIAVAKNSNDIKLITCILANIASSTFTLDVVPEVGDKVLVVYPKRYSNDMFDVDNNEVIIDDSASGYNLLSGIAILVNQYRKNQHHNFMQVKDGEISLKMAYDKDKGKNIVEVIATKDGDITIKNEKATVALDKEGNVTINTSGKYSIKNESTDLKSVIDGLATELENLTTTGSPATQATSPASKGTISTWRQSKLNQLLD